MPLSETLRQFDESDSVVESVGGWELSAARTTLFGASARAPEPLASPSAPAGAIRPRAPRPLRPYPKPNANSNVARLKGVLYFIGRGVAVTQ